MELGTGAGGKEFADAKLIDGTRQLLGPVNGFVMEDETIALRVLGRRRSEEGGFFGLATG